jgi:hypothetical protein
VKGKLASLAIFAIMRLVDKPSNQINQFHSMLSGKLFVEPVERQQKQNTKHKIQKCRYIKHAAAFLQFTNQF